MKFYRNFRKRLFNIYLLSIVIPFFILVFVCTGYFKNFYTTDVRRASNSLLSSVSYNIEYYLSGLNELSISPYAYAEVMDYLRMLHSKESISMERYSAEQKYKATINKAINLSRNDITAVLFIPLSDNPEEDAYITTRNTTDAASFNSKDITKQAWFQETVKKEGDPNFFYLSQPSYTPTAIKSSHVLFSVSRLIIDVDANQPLGVIRVDAENNNLIQILDQLEVQSHSNLLLLDKQNQLIYSKNPVTENTLQELTGNPTQIKTEDTYAVQSKQLKSSGWRLVSLDSYNDLNSTSRTIYFFAICISFLFVVITIVLYITSSNSMVKSIQEILSVMQKVEKGDLSPRSDVTGKDEIATISTALNRMIESLQEHINNEYIAVIRRKEIEYIALQSQINPHFLYNVLNGISVLNQLGDKKKVDEMVQHLTKLMRYSCQHNSQSTVGEECDFLERYLKLQKIRFEDRLNFSFTVAKNTRNLAIPKLLLQPLVENSIVHGMEPYDIYVQIELFSDLVNIPLLGGPCLLLIVRDNGVGFDVGSVDSVKCVGLQNVFSRLGLIHENCIFDIKSSLQMGTTIKMLIPIINNKLEEHNHDNFDS